jgi:hypothetical protein
VIVVLDVHIPNVHNVFNLIVVIIVVSLGKDMELIHRKAVPLANKLYAKLAMEIIRGVFNAPLVMVPTHTSIQQFAFPVPLRSACNVPPSSKPAPSAPQALASTNRKSAWNVWGDIVWTVGRIIAIVKSVKMVTVSMLMEYAKNAINNVSNVQKLTMNLA